MIMRLLRRYLKPFIFVLVAFIIVMMVAVFIVVGPQSRGVISEGASLSGRFAAIENFLDQFAMELVVPQPKLCVFATIEILASINPGLFATGAWGKGRAVPHGKVCVLSDLERTDIFVDPQLDGRVQGYELEGFHGIHAPVFDRFGGFVIHVSSQFRVIRVEGNDNTLVVHDSPIVRNGIDDFEFVGPPVGE